jgi:hypothetical protein
MGRNRNSVSINEVNETQDDLIMYQRPQRKDNKAKVRALSAAPAWSSAGSMI